MSERQLNWMYGQALQRSKSELALALLAAADKMANLSVVLESYIGAEGVKKLVGDDVTDELIKSLMKGARA